MSTATAKKTAQATSAHVPAAPEAEGTRPGAETGAFLRRIASANADLARQIAEFRAAHLDSLDEGERANLAGLSRGHSRIANTLVRDNPEAVAAA
jgi:hypothetical protein